MQCTAKSKRTHEQCRDQAMKGREVCYHHGGRTPLGPGSPHFQTGKFSKFLPSRMAADFNAAMGDPELVSLRKEIATVDARIIDVLKRVDTGEAGVIWQAAQAAMARFDREWVKKDGAGMEAALADMRRLMTQGASDWAAGRVVVGELIDAKRKLIDTEQRRITLAHESLTADRAMMMMAQVVRIVQMHVTDRQVLGAIAADMQAELLMRKREDIYEQARIGPDAAD
jgi:hypothetical protein